MLQKVENASTFRATHKNKISEGVFHVKIVRATCNVLFIYLFIYFLQEKIHEKVLCVTNELRFGFLRRKTARK